MSFRGWPAIVPSNSTAVCVASQSCVSCGADWNHHTIRPVSALSATIDGPLPREARLVEDLRLGEARQRLATTRTSIDSVAASVGFSSADSFRRAFERRFGLSPTTYRRRFGAEDGRAGSQ